MFQTYTFLLDLLTSHECKYRFNISAKNLLSKGNSHSDILSKIGISSWRSLENIFRQLFNNLYYYSERMKTQFCPSNN